MNAKANPTDEWTAGLAELSDRMVHARVTAPDERVRQQRLAGLLLVAPFPAAACLLFTFAGQLELPALMSAVCGIFAVCWAGLILLSLCAARRPVEWLVLGSGTVFIAALVAGAGGLASPAMALALAPMCEAWLIRRDRSAVITGLGAAGAITLAQMSISASTEWTGAASAANWLFVVAYGAMAAVRLRGAGQPPVREQDDSLQLAAEMAGTSALLLNHSGDILAVAYPTGTDGDLLAAQGQRLVDRVHVSDRVQLLTAIDDIRQGASRRTAELRLRSEQSYREARLELFAQEAGTVLAVLHDRSELTDLQAALDEANERAEGTEVAKGRFLGAVSHELRTPLNAIIGFSDMMLHNLAGELPAGRQRDYVELIRESGQHLLSVVNAILDVSKIEAGAYSIVPEPFELGEAADLCRSMMMPLAQAKQVSLSAHVRPSIGELVADRRAVQQMIINLMSNAIKFTPAGGEVRLDAVRHGSRLELIVSDNGIGISDEDLARLGQPFVQVCNDVTRQYEGTGLGLSLVKGLVRLHQGEMTIESAPGEGTTVRITLPMAGPTLTEPRERAKITDLSAVREPRTGEQNETVRKIA